MNSMPERAHWRANSAFSDRKPYPGWTACRSHSRNFECLKAIKGELSTSAMITSDGALCWTPGRIERQAPNQRQL
jgi:hypothetical protein